MVRTKEAIKVYKRIMNVFNEHSDYTLYDVDMFTHDISHELFTKTDPLDIDEDDYLIFQEALMLLVRDDLIADYYGTEGLAILHAELMDVAMMYYVKKEVTK